MDKIVKARKTHICSRCEKPIRAGEQYHYCKFREPVYADDVMYNSIQVGIKYGEYKLCLLCDYELSHDDEGLGPVPHCYGQGDYACGSEMCEMCEYETTCAK